MQIHMHIITKDITSYKNIYVTRIVAHIPFSHKETLHTSILQDMDTTNSNTQADHYIY